MNKKELKILLAEGEGYNIEFKENLDKDIDKTIVAFSNSSGGKILLGVDDFSQIKGLKITNELKATILNIARIIKSCKDKNIKVKFDPGEFFIVTFYRNKTTQKTTQKNLLTNLEEKIVEIISSENKISQQQIADKLNISINTVKEYIKKLKTKKIIERIGPDKGGYWKVNL